LPSSPEFGIQAELAELAALAAGGGGRRHAT